jgi:hypothetical protein
VFDEVTVEIRRHRPDRLIDQDFHARVRRARRPRRERDDCAREGKLQEIAAAGGDHVSR